MDTAVALATLGLTEGASPTDITRAFRVLSRASHPDHGGDRSRFEAVLAAYRALQRAGCARPARSRRPEPTVSTDAAPAGAAGAPRQTTPEPVVVIDVRSARPARDPYRRLLDELARAEATPYTRPRARRTITAAERPSATAPARPSFATFLAAALRDHDGSAA